MDIKIYDKQAGNLLVEKWYPNWNIETQNGVVDQTNTWDHLGRDSSYREIYFSEIHIGFGRARLQQTQHLRFDSDVNTVEMHFGLRGFNTARAAQFDHPVEFSSNQHNILFAQGLQADMIWQTGTYESCEINISPRLFQRYLPQGNALFDQFHDSMEKGRAQLLCRGNMMLTPSMCRLIEDIRQCDREGIFKRLYLEHKVMELLLTQLEQAVGSASASHQIKRADTEKICAVKDFIVNNLDTQSSLSDLARMVGTNEYTLKLVFKKIVGMPVFAFWREQKLQRAKAMLLDSTLTLADIAFLTGYADTRHFSTAFKRKFGLLPSSLRRSG